MSRNLYWGLLLPFAASIGLVVFAQTRFEQQDMPWYETCAVYLLAMSVFAWVSGRLRRETPATQTESIPNVWAGFCRTFQTPAGQVCLMGVALLAMSQAALEANRIPNPSSIIAVMVPWVLSLVAFAAAFLPWADLANWRLTGPGQMWFRLRPALPQIALLAGIIFVAFVLRAYDLEHIPANFGGDEGEMGLQARAFLSGDLRDPFATSWMDHQTMWFFLQSLSIRLLGQTVSGLRMLSALFGTLSILTTFLLVRELFNRNLASVTAAVLAVSAFHLHFSRLAISSIGDPFWTTLVLFLFVRGLSTRRTIYFVMAGLALGYSQTFYHGMRLLLITLALFLAYCLAQDYESIRRQLRNLVIMGTGAVIAAAPLILFYVRFPDLFVGHYNAMGIIPSGWLARTVEQSGQPALVIILERIQHYLLAFNAYPEYSGFYAPQRPLLDTVSGILFLFGAAYAVFRLKNRGYFLFLSWFVLAMFFGAVMVIDENGVERFVTASVPVAFLVSVGLAKLAVVAARLIRLAPRRRWGLVAVVVAFIAILNLHFYFIEYLPRRLNSGIGAGRSTEMARLFLSQKVPFKVYFFGAPDHYLNHGTIRYMAPDVEGIDVVEQLEGTPDFVDSSKRALFVFHPMRASEFEFVQRAYPNGEFFDYKLSDGQEVFFYYIVDDPQEISQ